METVLVLYDDTEIKAWLVGETIESAEAHIRNGYPDLIETWQAGTLKAEVIEVPDEDAFSSYMYEVKDGVILRKKETL